MRGVDARTALLGDWPVRGLRDPLDVLRLHFAVGALVTALLGDTSASLNLLVATVAVFLARPALLPRAYDLAFILVFVIAGWGEALDLYDRYEHFDDGVHTVVPLLVSQIAYLVFARLEVVPDPRDRPAELHHRWTLGVLTAAFGIALAGLWEICEWTSDELLGTDMSLSNDDTVTDLIFGTVGSMAGGVLMVLWATRGWGSVRRVRGSHRELHDG